MVEALRKAILLCLSQVALPVLRWDVLLIAESRRVVADGVATRYCTCKEQEHQIHVVPPTALLLAAKDGISRS
jgi:hypothetical protein